MRTPLSGRGAVLGQFSISHAIAMSGQQRSRGRVDNDALAWAAAVAANGGSYTPTQVLGLSTFFKTLRAAQMWPMKFAGFGPQAGNDLPAALVQYAGGVWSPATNFNFVASDYSPSTGLTGNAVNKQLDTGIQIPGLTKSDFGMGAWLLTPWASSARMAFIASSYLPTGATNRFYNHSIGVSTSDTAIGNEFGATPTGTGLNAQETVGTTVQNVYWNGTRTVSRAAWNNDGFQPGTVVLYANGNAFFSNHALGGYYVGNNMDQVILTAAWAALNASLGR